MEAFPWREIYLFLFKKKLDKNLKIALYSDRYKFYRIIIHCRALIENILGRIKSSNGEIIGVATSIHCIFANLSSKTIERLIEYPEVDYVTFDDFAYLCGNSAAASNMVRLSAKLKYTGKGICIGVIDSGVYPHPDLMSHYKKIDKFIDTVNGLNYPYDDNGHGTFMAGIICGNGNASKGLYAGIAPNSTIYSIKAFNAIGKAYVSNILIALDLLISESKEHNLKVICLPFELTTEDAFIISSFYKLFNLAVKHNISIVISSGSNENEKSSIRGIATLNNCITVGGLDTTSIAKSYKFSSCGPCGKLMKPDLSAASVNICSLAADKNYISERNGLKTYPRKLENYYTTFSGTSCSAAYVSGVCALLYERNSDLQYKDVLSLLKGSCKLLQFPKWQQGEGILQLDELFFNE